MAHTILEYTLEDPNTDQADIVRLVNSAEDVGHPDHLLFDRLARPITKQVFSEDTTVSILLLPETQLIVLSDGLHLHRLGHNYGRYR